MKAEFEKYLTMVERYLKPLPTSERVDIVKEIKGSILEMEQEDLSEEEILQRLGEPKDLAKAYLGDLLIKESDFSFTRVLTVCAFYSVAGLSGMFVIPILGIVAPVFIVCSLYGGEADGSHFSPGASLYGKYRGVFHKRRVCYESFWRVSCSPGDWGGSLFFGAGGLETAEVLLY